MRVEGFVIHLERAAARRAQAEAIAAALPVETRLLPAVDGRAMDAAARSAFRKSLHRPRYPFALSDTETGCFLSHRAAWQAIVDGGLDFGIIVEDDVVVDDPRLAQAIPASLGWLQHGDYLRIPVKPKRERGPVRLDGASLDGDGFAIVEPELPGLGMQMQVVGREAATRLLKASATFDRPVDSLVQMQWLHGARVLSLHPAHGPALAAEISAELGGTVVQKKNMPLMEKLFHEIRRPLLRLSVARANARWRARTGWRAAP
jgi:GR25 family glycosyltransferase involved in LPS biosynthesis